MESSVSSSRHHAIYFVREPGGLESDTREKLAHNSKSPSPASNEIMNPSDVPTEMTSKRRRLLQPASEKLQVLAAINNGFHTLRFVSEELRCDREVILAGAVNKYGPQLEYASQQLQSDREVVLAAVNADGYALQYASEELRSDREVVLAAVKNNYGPACNLHRKRYVLTRRSSWLLSRNTQMRWSSQWAIFHEKGRHEWL